MTNPPPSGGMPKWLIIVLVIGLVVIFGCCGGVYTCTHFFARAAATGLGTGVDKLRQLGEQKIKEAQEEQRKQAAEQARQNGGQNPVEPIPENPSSPGAPNTPGFPSGSTPPVTKLPANFPSDIPVFSGLVPNFADSDKIADSGSVIFTGADTSENTANYYEKAMADHGWSQDSSKTINDSYIQSYSKDGRSVSLSVMANGDKKTTVTIAYTKK